MHDDIPELRIQPMDQGSPLLLLEQDGGGNVDRIAVHPIHVRYMAERLGLAESSDLDAHRTIARLSRRLRLLTGRIVELADQLDGFSDALEREKAHVYARATADLAEEFCAELPPEGRE